MLRPARRSRVNADRDAGRTDTVVKDVSIYVINADQNAGTVCLAETRARLTDDR